MTVTFSLDTSNETEIFVNVDVILWDSNNDSDVVFSMYSIHYS